MIYQLMSVVWCSVGGMPKKFVIDINTLIMQERMPCSFLSLAAGASVMVGPVVN